MTPNHIKITMPHLNNLIVSSLETNTQTTKTIRDHHNHQHIPSKANNPNNNPQANKMK
jgi:hypothetical protein